MLLIRFLILCFYLIGSTVTLSEVILLKDLIVNIFGTYEPVSYVDVDGVTQYLSGAAGVDWPYVLGAAAFILTIYCVLRIIGGVISRV